MQFQLEQLDYQDQATQAVVSIFDGQDRNTFDNACRDGIRSNYLSLSGEQILNNVQRIMHANSITAEATQSSDDRDYCIEMETGTGKTLVYIKTIYELFKKHEFTKFIILVPSVAIKEGVLTTLESFERQLEDIYHVKPDYFEYDSKRLPKVTNFIESQHPQIMVMTVQSFNTDDRILNQSQREDLFSNMPFIEAIAKTNPIIIMDEPQEGMDTGNSIERIATLNPMVKLRYSATHKVLRNLLYRLTPFESYKQGLVKKIEVLTVSEKNDEASMKIEVNKVDIGKGEPKAILRAWHSTASGFKFKNTKKVGTNTSLFEVTGNVIYKDYVVDQIAKPIRGRGFVKFKNESIIYEGDQAKDYSAIFSEQLYWMIDAHFRKKESLKKHGIKCLSLVFIDRVDNYILPDGIIRKAFAQQYRKAHKEFYKKTPEVNQVEQVQGYYFAKTNKGDYTDNLRAMESNKEMFDEILRDKEKLLSLDNPREFIFSHSALGVGWDNPNVFNIATLNQSYSDIKKRQEIGRGLRICVNQDGQRVYDLPTTPEGEEINLLTVVPNETYETFIDQYQAEIEEVYGTSKNGAETRHRHKGNDKKKKRIKRNDTLFNSPSFKGFWNKLAKKTEYLVVFDENRIIQECIDALNSITISEHLAQITLNRLQSIRLGGREDIHLGQEHRKMTTSFSALDIIEELSENTSLAYPTVFKIVQGLTNQQEIIKNPPRFIQEAIRLIRNIELDEMLRALEYRILDESFELDKFQKYIVRHTDRIEDTPNRGIYNKIVWESEYERNFAKDADADTQVICFLKLPAFYVINTPAGEYTPDFGLVLKKRTIRDGTQQEFYFVIETKGTHDIEDRKALTENEIYKIKCAAKHFEALGIETKVHYHAPVDTYQYFKSKAEVVHG